MAGNNSEEKKSVCEKSMEEVVNIIKLSSFSLAAMNLGKKHDAAVGLIPFKSFTASSTSSSNSQISKSKRSSQLAALNKRYLREEDGNFSDYIERLHKKNKNNEVITDGKVTAFIRKFHEKNSRHYTPTVLSLALPPPPPMPPPSLNK